MTKNTVTLHDLMELSKSIDAKLDKLGEDVTDLKIWRAEIKGKIAVVVVLMSFGVTMAWDFVKERFRT